MGQDVICARVANPRCLRRLAIGAQVGNLPHFALVILCLVVLPALLTAQAEDPRSLIQQAYALQQAGDFTGAAAAYRAFLKLRPDEVGAQSNLGVVLVKLGRYDEAISEYQAAFRLAPDDARIGVNLALALVKSGRLSEAAESFESLHRRMPAEQKITLLLADTQLQLGDDDRVIEFLRPLARTDSSDLSVAYMLGMALLRKQQIGEGQVLLDRILGNGDTAEARFLLGTRMFETGDYPAAASKLASAVTLNPDLPGLQSLYGRALLATGDPDGASEAFRKELASNPNDFPANLALGQILLVRKRYAEAQPVLERALSLRPSPRTRPSPRRTAGRDQPTGSGAIATRSRPRAGAGLARSAPRPGVAVYPSPIDQGGCQRAH